MLDGGQHARDQIGILGGDGRRDQVIQNQAGFAMNQENLLDAIQQAVHQHDFGEGLAGAHRFHAPFQAARGKAIVERFVERFEHAAQSFGDGFADRRAHHREQRVGQHVRIAAHGFAQRFLNGGS